ncbi:MAG: hypothetical protein HY329_05775 [Chloroflexi bacterium]|nr:hypothetical protein [Chloroflexota bacterium]
MSRYDPRIKDREAKLRSRRERMPKHGRSLAEVYRRAVERRARKAAKREH